ncbi:hypothetical protein [Sphingomonas solaris]|uniref:Uncharacterized protein n=1 Tax=Alterirhizorhabdus solaris TaxID=2529389 RepID=A0A558R8I7_9SPHN|nr:hypothetical protein [Sphingomonas solaris]TVV75638.1 hypothetical protein FOY91_06475 [Sphingomonas solaris]
MATAAPAESMTIAAELQARIDQLARDSRMLSVGELCRRVDAVRNIAAARRLLPLARLAGSLRDALAEGGRGTPMTPWIEAMRESLGHDAQDEATARAFVASVGVRLAG